MKLSVQIFLNLLHYETTILAAEERLIGVVKFKRLLSEIIEYTKIWLDDHINVPQ